MQYKQLVQVFLVGTMRFKKKNKGFPKQSAVILGQFVFSNWRI